MAPLRGNSRSDLFSMFSGFRMRGGRQFADQMNQPDQQTRISVIVPCLGQADELNNCLMALAEQNLESPYEVLVVDSGHDPAVMRTVAKFVIARLIRGDHGLEAGLARNTGVKVATGHYLVFTDADCVPKPDYLKIVEGALDNGIRALTGPILDADKRCIPACDNLLQFVDFSPRRPAGPAQLAPGCNLAMGRQDFIDLGGFREGRAEDVRLSLQVANQIPTGLSYCPEMIIGHQGRSTWSAYIDHQLQFGFDRGRYAILVTPIQRYLGRLRLMVLPVALKRFSYIVRSTIKWKRERLLTVMIRSPLLIAGLIAWSVGFRRGLIAALHSSDLTDD